MQRCLKEDRRRIMNSLTNIPPCVCKKCQDDPTGPTAILHAQMRLFMSTLDERQRRLFAGLEANRNGHGGQKAIAEILGVSLKTIRRGQRELEQAEVRPGIRRPGGGRKRIEQKRLALKTAPSESDAAES
jgi:hypothetical protein